MNKIIVCIVCCFMSWQAIAQTTDYKKQYEYAKSLVDEERYDAAVQMLKPILKEEPENAYALYAQYLYAYASFQQAQYTDARDVLLQLRQLHADWQEHAKVTWLLASTYAHMNEYRKAVSLAQQLSITTPDLDAWKSEYYPLIQPLDTLIKIQKSFPLDLKLAETLYTQLVAKKADQKYKAQVALLEKEYGFKPIEKERKHIRNVVKDRYHLALLFPFNRKEIDWNANQRSNQYVLDFYSGMKMAIDSLNADKKSAPIELHAYDTEKDVNKVAQIVKYNEWKAVDVVIGPMFAEQYNYIKDLPEMENKILISPMSYNSKFAETTGSFLYKPSLEYMVSGMSDYAATHFVQRKNSDKDPGILPKKNVLILYGKEIKDSLMAYQYKDSITKKGFIVKNILKVDMNYMPTLRTFTADSMGLLGYSHIAALSTDPIFAANFISLMEITQQVVPIFAYNDWLDNTQLSYHQMDKREVYFVDPDFVRTNSSTYKEFHKTYIAKYHVFPSIYVLQGYEMVTLLGKALRAKGTDVALYFDEKKYFNLGMLGGYDYSYSYCNKYVPLVTFRDLKLTIVNEKSNE